MTLKSICTESTPKQLKQFKGCVCKQHTKKRKFWKNTSLFIFEQFSLPGRVFLLKNDPMGCNIPVLAC